MVYFGAKEDVQKGGKAAIVRNLAQLDRYNFMDRAAFYYNDDPDCLLAEDLKKGAMNLRFYNGGDSSRHQTVDLREEDNTLVLRKKY